MSMSISHATSPSSLLSDSSSSGVETSRFARRVPIVLGAAAVPSRAVVPDRDVDVVPRSEGKKCTMSGLRVVRQAQMMARFTSTAPQ